MEKILISCLSYVETALLRGRGGGGVVTQLTRIKWVGRSLPHSFAEKKLSKKECSALIRYLLAGYVISHMLLHTQ